MSVLMNASLLGGLVLPFLIALLVLVFAKAGEKYQSWIASVGAHTILALNMLIVAFWLSRGGAAFELDLGEIYSSADYHFPILLYFDWIGAVFFTVTTLIGVIIVKYCRYYLHREAGYARFFSTIFAFLGGMGLLALAGTLDLLFAGWEIVGISSFLLIGFYRDRVNPQRNAFRAYTIYRLCDVGLLMGAWLGHLLWHHSQHFSNLLPFGPEMLQSLGVFPILGLSFLILLAACGKSAQFPFCFWLPRAMEGPTPSSAIFYGALSIHAGVFLLLRTMPIWHTLVVTRVAVAAVGLSTTAIATLSARVQSNVKGQIGYASIAQVGLMLVELALDLPGLVVLHFVGNAFLRCYQLLVSPSVVSHLLRVQTMPRANTQLSDYSIEQRLSPRLRSSLYAFAIHEGYLEEMIRAILWNPLQKSGRWIHRFDRRPFRAAGIVAALLTVGAMIYGDVAYLPTATFAMILLAVAASLSALAERQSAVRAWNAIGYSALLAAGAVYTVDTSSFPDVLVYLSGISPAWGLGLAAISALPRGRNQQELRWYHGLASTQPYASALLFFAALGLTGFPISPAFLGQDLLLHHATGNNLWLAVALSLTFVVNGLTAIRMCSRLCFGPNELAAEESVSSDRTVYSSTPVAEAAP